METFCFKIINDLDNEKRKNQISYKKALKINSKRVSIKNKFIFFKFDHKELDTDLEKIKFFNTYVFQYPEPIEFLEKNFLNKNFFFVKNGKYINIVF